MTGQPREVAKLGDTITFQCSALLNHRLLSIKLETQKAVDFANAELLNWGRWRIVRDTPQGKENS